MNRPLEGLLVLEFCQFLAGPSAGLKLADLGARVIKIERPKTGDACRSLSIKNLFVDEDSLLFHTINRNKESYTADLKNPEDLERLKRLISKADVMTHNFRPGVMEKIGLDYENVQKVNPKIVYGMVTGYGSEGPWKNKPGQDLLVQSVSGLTFLSGVDVDGPVPFGLSVSDIMCGNHLAQGIMAALIKRAKTNKSVLVEVSLLESILDVQFEVLTTYLNDGGKLPDRSGAKGSAHAYLSAPYGMYQTNDGYIAMAMGNLPNICTIINCDITDLYVEAGSAFENRDKLIVRLAETFKKEDTKHWVDLLEGHGIWCAEVLNYQTATALNTYKSLQIEQELDLDEGKKIKTTVSPIRLDNEKLFASKAAPKLGFDTAEINKEFELS
ncbi:MULTISPECIES: CaiB/BaiF CoA-transferase family protein [unclassified Pedobacter]|uniref:CaiB/BaiF CoA transferase family protein n=1 Tax=unclassified Pedobacter TaxID=2628915 RepID=UPI001D832D9B|nr:MULTISPECIES: CaiB/BaiF CoA-transferase family protein [unclassified Pedobacter]CAH0139725.1 Acetyl-CoA:oxalate CoA-transferase [Pedobacter sp. Bi36]CAH0195436.1 Acetyl-CoA:oxalate CoA-transferase [Pedobacter sp. Bi126]